MLSCHFSSFWRGCVALHGCFLVGFLHPFAKPCQEAQTWQNTAPVMRSTLASGSMVRKCTQIALGTSWLMYFFVHLQQIIICMFLKPSDFSGWPSVHFLFSKKLRSHIKMTICLGCYLNRKMSFSPVVRRPTDSPVWIMKHVTVTELIEGEHARFEADSNTIISSDQMNTWQSSWLKWPWLVRRCCVEFVFLSEQICQVCRWKAPTAINANWAG